MTLHTYHGERKPDSSAHGALASIGADQSPGRRWHGDGDRDPLRDLESGWHRDDTRYGDSEQDHDHFSAFHGEPRGELPGRTTPTGTGGTITLKVASDFSPGGGPSAASNALTYVCSGATLGTACSGTQTASTTSSTPVLTVPVSACTGGGGSCSSQSPNSVNLNFTLVDSPVYPTGTYSANITFTISAT